MKSNLSRPPTLCLAILLFILSAGSSFALPVFNPINGHYYDLFTDFAVAFPGPGTAALASLVAACFLALSSRQQRSRDTAVTSDGQALVAAHVRAGPGVRQRDLHYAAAVFFGSLLLWVPTVAPAADINWVGYQFGPPGGFQTNFSNTASFFHGDQWLNYVVPGQNDRAIFDTTVDPQGNGMPSIVKFGDFTMPAVPIYNPNSFTIPGGSALLDILEVRKGDFSFRFTNDFGQPQGSLTVTNAFGVATNQPIAAPAPASLTLDGPGTLTTAGAVLGNRTTAASGTVNVSAPTAEWHLATSGRSDLSISRGLVRVSNGGTIRGDSGSNVVGRGAGANGRFEVDGGTFITGLKGDFLIGFESGDCSLGIDYEWRDGMV